MIQPTHMEQSFPFHTAMPEIVEEGSHTEAFQSDREGLKPMSLSPPTFHRNFFPQNHQHHESTSTSASESAGSSPTTIGSTNDDSSVTELSPGSSPESPMSKTPLPSMGIEHARPQTSDDARLHSHTAPFFEMQRPSTPGKKPRNLKNLAVNTTGNSSSTSTRSTNTALPLAKPSLQELPKVESKIAFAKPPNSPRRKPSNLSLTIMTPALNKNFSRNTSHIVPPTPSLSRPELRHFQSSPSLPLFPNSFAATSAPSVLSISRPSPTRSYSEHHTSADDDEPNFDIPQSKEEKPEAYPLGPICVFEPHVDLYLEPTAIQARAYDVVLNVASEVRNPFIEIDVPVIAETEFRLDGGGGIQYAPKRDRNPVQSGLPSTLKTVQELATPTTPKAVVPENAFESATEKDPEYIHIPWEHNTDIVPDLLRLVQLIDERVKKGKRVLVHCQCGVSRSATLVVAYGMYKNPSLSVQEAYDAVKKRSKWIGPNMNLIMQLQEFRSSLISGTSRRTVGLRSLTPIEASSSWDEWRRPGTQDAATPKTAPLCPQIPSSRQLSVDSLAISPGPSSAPSGLSWPFHAEKLATSVDDTEAARKDARAQSVPGPVPIIEEPQEIQTSPKVPKEKRRPHSLRFDSGSNTSLPNASLAHVLSGPEPSPRSREFAMTALQPAREVAPEDKFGLLSPSTNQFRHSPLDRDVLLGSLGMGAAFNDEASRKRPQNFSFPQRRSILPAQPLPSVESVTENKPSSGQATSTTITEVTGPAVDSGPEEDHLQALMSPRASEFTLNPYQASQSGSEGATTSSNTSMSKDDPRSPPQKGANPITRNIADLI